jgi:predicted SAM-dependent methyltransferase
MSDYSENGESPVSHSSHRGEELFKAVREAVEDWVADESISIEREEGDIVADEDELVENISIMVAIAVDEAAD